MQWELETEGQGVPAPPEPEEVVLRVLEELVLQVLMKLEVKREEEAEGAGKGH